jgi:hypothetical protein
MELESFKCKNPACVNVREGAMVLMVGILLIMLLMIGMSLGGMRCYVG